MSIWFEADRPVKTRSPVRVFPSAVLWEMQLREAQKPQ
jgi:hypothetical protein